MSPFYRWVVVKPLYTSPSCSCGISRNFGFRAWDDWFVKHILGAKEHRGEAKYCNLMFDL